MSDVKETTLNTSLERAYRPPQQTGSQAEEAQALAQIMHRTIRKQGKFTEKLTDYAHAFARTENFAPATADRIIRDRFKEEYGQSMNAMREGLMEREQKLSQAGHDQALQAAHLVTTLIRDGDTMPFWQAFDRAGEGLAVALDITDSGAKRLMKSAYEAEMGNDLYTVGKELEQVHHRPVAEAVQTRVSQPHQTAKHSR